ncbi:CD1247 N-terminal domain-containing protein [Natranaerobius thermophilus]|uniref:Uncharacterized protein n=1 Tax=Natranaerobius thermophilus (strain ATCC BAA-1301 / DSM 18059 / JW/NM-WN-LF) TaxID=457570 RepID=B2A548_NATTJ|nr:CD1247 N-terminal domain-containing protein [Natranaerobius thermophilus]ACB85290.1 conserved hypothetical protein [Natranaerobius thermophilus JW/NM-WN-LF]
MQYRVSYLKGMMDGMNMVSNSQEGKVISEIVSVLEDFADAFDEMDADLAMLENHVDGLDADLEFMETHYYNLDEEAPEESTRPETYSSFKK